MAIFGIVVNLPSLNAAGISALPPASAHRRRPNDELYFHVPK
jgi:hypothetical protein